MLFCSPLSADNPTIASPLSGSRLEEVIVVATRDQQSAFTIPYTVELISRSDLDRKLIRSLPQALKDTPGVLVQETSYGQGSPYIRGFTGFRNVFLIDGVRMNNSVLRDGPNQYWATVDHFGLDRLEVMRGPGSTLYGSDAVGGVVNAITPDPFSAPSRVFVRAASADHSVIGRYDFQHQLGESSALWAGVTAKHFGDLESGGNTGTQKGVGYDEQGFDIKFSMLVQDDWRLDAFAQRVAQHDVPRTHRTRQAKSWKGTTVGSDQKRDLDQTRELAYLRVTGNLDNELIETASYTVSFSYMEEERDRVRRSGTREKQGFDVETFGASAQFTSALPMGSLIWGVDYYSDRVDSYSSRDPIQGPMADDASFDAIDLFLEYQLSLTERWDAILGARRTHTSMDADSVRHPVHGRRVEVSDNWDETVFNARLSYQLIPGRLIVFGGIGEAFRAPNLSDLTRYDSSRSNEFEIPAPGLEPEAFLTGEIGVRWHFEGSRLDIAAFHTKIDGQIQRIPTGRRVGGETEISKANIGDGWVKGFEVAYDVRVNESWLVFGAITWMDGEVDTYPTSTPVRVREPISRLMPRQASLGVRWGDDASRFWSEMSLTAARRQSRLSTRDAGDSSRIPAGGTPGYTVVNWSAGYRFSDNLRFIGAIDNIGDVDYRVHGSGTNSAGRNYMLAMELTI